MISKTHSKCLNKLKVSCGTNASDHLVIMDSDVFYFTILALIAIWICKKFLTTEGELKTLGVAHEKPLPIIGNALPIILQKENFVEIGDRLYKKFSEEQ